MNNLLFLTGIGRSGTTLLQQMLHAHSQINFKPETHFFKSYILPHVLGKSLSTEAFQEKVKEDVYIKRLTFAEQNKLVALSTNQNSLVQRFEALLTNANVAYGADKDTEYVRYFPHLKSVYSNAFLINIIRDPREVVLSRKKTPWGSKRSTTFHAAEYIYYFKKNRKEGPEIFGDRYIEVQFEKLLDNPEKVLATILKKLGLSFEKEILNYSKSSNSLIADDEKAWKGNADKPLLKNNTKKWESELDSGIVGLIESEIGDEMVELGYSLAGSKKSNFKAIELKTILAAFAFKTKKEQLRG